MNKAVFLDRDGVINDGTLYYTFNIDDFKLNPDIPEALSLLHKNGFLLIVVTNQSGIAKGVFSESDLSSIHTHMQTLLKKHNVTFTHIFHCPHHPDIASCECRKPKNKLFEDAIAMYDIDRDKSYMIGDSERDIDAAKKSGIKGFLIQKNESILNLSKQIVELNNAE